MINQSLIKIAKELLALSKWVKIEKSKNGWKRVKDDGKVEYRYQDTDPNLGKTKPVEFKPEPITPEEKRALSVYTQVGYAGINRYLRGLAEPSKNTIERINKILALLKKLPPYKGDVYRGVSLEKNKHAYEFLSTLKPGDVIKSVGFLSTSEDSSTARNFSLYGAETHPVFFKIKSKTGRSITELSSFEEKEDEVLFPPNVNFKVTKIDFGVPNIYIDLEEVDEEPTKIPIKNMDASSLRNALLRKDLSLEQRMNIKSLPQTTLDKIIQKIIEKHGPYFVI